MMSHFMKKVFFITLLFGLLYAAIFFMPGLVVYPTDYIIELFTGKEYIDGWTPGLMVWTALLYIFPIVYLVFISALWLGSRKDFKKL